MDRTGMDLLISFDTTGSMYPVLTQVRNKVQSFAKEMFTSVDDLRIGVIAHGDYCDADNPYTIRILDFTDNISKICDFVNNTASTYGGDADECYELVLNSARTRLNWGASRSKIFVLIGDASPHGVDYPDNKDRLDWKNESGLLNEAGVRIFAVHALSYYRNSSKSFYNTIATSTNGKYLTLDQFSEITDLIKATCYASYSEEKLNDFISIIKNNGRMTHSMAKNIGRLTGKEIQEPKTYVQKDGLIPVKPGRFQVMTVDENCIIKDFVESNGIKFNKGRGFYELTKHETIQQYKEVIIQDRETGEMFTGAQVRERLGLQPQVDKGGVKESLSSKDIKEFRIFVQSTSYNRKLIGKTSFLYEINDIEDTGTTIKIPELPEVKSKEKKKATTSKETKKKDTTKDIKAKETKETKETKLRPAKRSKKERMQYLIDRIEKDFTELKELIHTCEED